MQINLIWKRIELEKIIVKGASHAGFVCELYFPNFSMLQVFHVLPLRRLLLDKNWFVSAVTQALSQVFRDQIAMINNTGAN